MKQHLHWTTSLKNCKQYHLQQMRDFEYLTVLRVLKDCSLDKLTITDDVVLRYVLPRLFWGMFWSSTLSATLTKLEIKVQMNEVVLGLLGKSVGLYCHALEHFSMFFWNRSKINELLQLANMATAFGNSRHVPRLDIGCFNSLEEWFFALRFVRKPGFRAKCIRLIAAMKGKNVRSLLLYRAAIRSTMISDILYTGYIGEATGYFNHILGLSGIKQHYS